MTRLLVTGSRDWHDSNLVRAVLQGWLDRYPDTVLVHGHCKTGADAQADRFFRELGLDDRIERHPADWATHGKKAGPIRNHLMVDTRPDQVVAFILGGSPGATDCADYAEKKGLPVRRWTA